jgi:hypothetical protein
LGPLRALAQRDPRIGQARVVNIFSVIQRQPLRRPSNERVNPESWFQRRPHRNLRETRPEQPSCVPGMLYNNSATNHLVVSRLPETSISPNFQARMEFTAAPILACLVFMARLSTAATLASVISPSQWQALNTTVSGRLHADGTPFARACFQVAEGLSGGPDAAACAAIQAQYTAEDFREQAYGSYMNVGTFAAHCSVK